MGEVHQLFWVLNKEDFMRGPSAFRGQHESMYEEKSVFPTFERCGLPVE